MADPEKAEETSDTADEPKKKEGGSERGESDPPWPSDMEKSAESSTESPAAVPEDTPFGQVPEILKEKMGSDIPKTLRSTIAPENEGDEGKEGDKKPEEGEEKKEEGEEKKEEGEEKPEEGEEEAAEGEEKPDEAPGEQEQKEQTEEPGESEDEGDVTLDEDETTPGDYAGAARDWDNEWPGEGPDYEWGGEDMEPPGVGGSPYAETGGEDGEEAVQDLARWLGKQLMEGLDSRGSDVWSLDKAFEKAKEVDECEAPKIPLLEHGGAGSDSQLAVKEVTDELVRRAANQARRIRRERRRMREAERLLEPASLRKWLEDRTPCTCVECTCMYIDRRREYDNPFPDFSASSDKGLEYIGPGADGPTLRESFLLRLQSAGNTYFSLFQDEWRMAMERNDDEAPTRDPSIYTGLCGLALHRLRGEGPIAQQCVNKMRALLPLVLNLRSGQSNELLFGRAGYLYAQLFVRAHVAKEAVPGGEVRAVAEAILRACGRVSRDEPDTESPLLVRWQGHLYLGAAHGVVGALFALLAAKQYLTGFELRTLIKPALQFLQEQMLPTGNLPARVDEEIDKQVQWCIGAPGAVHLFCLAHKVYGEPAFMETAVRMANVVWKRGLLTKGYGLCHGVAGNAFSFLALYQATNDAKWLYRACAFAEWCFAYGCYQEAPPEAPLSLFEGVLGVVHFFLQLEDPMNAKFPGFATLP